MLSPPKFVHLLKKRFVGVKILRVMVFLSLRGHPTCGQGTLKILLIRPISFMLRRNRVRRTVRVSPGIRRVPRLTRVGVNRVARPGLLLAPKTLSPRGRGRRIVIFLLICWSRRR